MSSEDFADRTEAPTPRRREQFRREGRVARSADLSAAVIMISVILVLAVTGGRLAGSLESIFKSAFAVNGAALDAASIHDAAGSMLWVLSPMLITAFVLAVVAIVVQTGRPNFFHRPRRQFGLKRSPGALGGFWAGLVKLIIIGFATYQFIGSRLGQLIAMQHADLRQFLSFFCHTLFAIALRIALVLLAFGIVDYAIQRYRLEKQLRMTRRELQDELRQTEGDPRIKARRRQLAGGRGRPAGVRA